MLAFSTGDVEMTGPLIGFIAVLAGSLGIPIPSLAAVIYIGSLVAKQHDGVAAAALIFAASMVGAVVGDFTWFMAGRRFGTVILGLLCRLSLSRDSCVRRTADTFARRGIKMLLVARFVPGLTVVMAPLAGISGVSVARFPNLCRNRRGNLDRLRAWAWLPGGEPSGRDAADAAAIRPRCRRRCRGAGTGLCRLQLVSAAPPAAPVAHGPAAAAGTGGAGQRRAWHRDHRRPVRHRA